MNATRIRELNDMLRSTFDTGGQVVLTAGVSQLSANRLSTLLAAVRGFSTFDADNDPHDEHDFGSVEIENEKFFWKIDYYDVTLVYGSPDPSDPAVTTRVLTIMRAEEY
jgi:hypothetical protein